MKKVMKVKLILSTIVLAFFASSCGGEDKSVPQFSTQEGVEQIISELC